MTDSRIDFLSSRWKVFFDGVEVPHQGLSVSFTTDAESYAVIYLEPSPQLTKLRPRTLVHIFARRFFPEYSDGSVSKPVGYSLVDEMLEQFELYWEGTTVVMEHNKTPQARNIAVKCLGLLSTLETVKAFSIGIGPLTYSPILSGSTLPPVLAQNGEMGGTSDASTDTLTFVNLTSNFADQGAAGEDIDFRDSTTPTFVDRVLRNISYLAKFNTLLRQQVVRERLLDKICGVPDSLLPSLITHTQMNSLMNGAVNMVQPEHSVMDIIRIIMSYGFYHYSFVPFPHTPSVQPKQGDKYPFPQAVSDIHQFPKGKYRNDIVFHPETYFALPPPCNFIFPEQLTSFTASRGYMNEPTRYMVEDPYVLMAGQRMLTYLTPASIIRKLTKSEQRTISSSGVYGTLTNLGAVPDASNTSAYGGTQTIELPAEEVNLLNVFSDSELEKGLIAGVGLNGLESFVIQAASVPKLGESVDENIKSSIDDLSKDDNYRGYMTQLINYIFYLKKNEATTINATVSGHRGLAVGWPILIMDKDISYVGQLSSLSFTADSEGLEVSTLMITKARAIPKLDITAFRAALDSVTNLQKTHNENSEILSSALVTKTLVDFRKLRDDVTTFLDIIDGIVADFTGTVLAETDRLRLFLTGKVATLSLSEMELLVQDKLGALKKVPGDHFVEDTYVEYQTLAQIFDPDGYSSSDNLVEGAAFPISITPAKIYLSQLQSMRTLVNIRSPLPVVTGSNVRTAEELTIYETTSLIRAFVDFSYEILSDILTKNVGFLITDEAISSTESQDTIVLAALSEISRTTTEIEGIVDDMIDKYDLVVPPAFFNQNLIHLEKLDEVYKELLGCKPFYTSEYAKGASQLPAFTITFGPMTEVGRLSAVLEYWRGLLAINQVYPILGGSLSTDEKVTSLSWNYFSKDALGHKSAIEWAYKSFIERQGTSLKQFLEDNELTLETVMTDATEELFYNVFHPKALSSDQQTAGKTWDNSIFSKIVDDKQLAGEGSDSFIQEVRQNVTSNFLTTAERQAIIREYTALRFTRKGFDGS